MTVTKVTVHIYAVHPIYNEGQNKMKRLLVVLPKQWCIVAFYLINKCQIRSSAVTSNPQDTFSINVAQRKINKHWIVMAEIY